MATIIKSISFQNFYNYYGSFEQNTYKFKEGINIVNADNNMGKSKFYNGILWLLKDCVYDSDLKRMEPVSSSYLKMASGKAKNENPSFVMGVRVEFMENSHSYLIEKSVKFEYSGNSWSNKNEQINVLQTIDSKTISIPDLELKNQIIKKVIPVELMNYALLQGESMEKLVDLSSRDGLSSTIEALADISNFNEICSISKELTKKAKSLLSTQEKESTQNKDKIEFLITDKDRIETYKEQSREKIEEYKKELSEAKNKKEALEALQLNATKREKFRTIQKQLLIEIENLKTEKKNKEQNITSMLFSDSSPWILMGLQDNIEQFGKLRDMLNVEITKQKVIKDPTILLPENSPDTMSLKRMLEKGHCEICDRPAPKDTEAWKHIEMVMNRPKNTEDNNINNFSSFYGNIQNTVGSFFLSIPNVAQSIDDYRDKIEHIESQINQKQEEYENSKLEFINAGGSESNSDITDRKNISEHTLAENTEREMKELIDKTNKQIDSWDIRLSQIDIELQNLSENTKIKDYRNFRDIMCAIELMLNNSKERVFDEIIKSLEINANQKYSDLTAGNATSGGKLCFTKQADNTVQVSIKDCLNGEMTGLGNGFQRLKQLSIVMAIISSKIGNKQFNYPFISDAPFSEFGDNFVNNFIDVAPNVFVQSIILIKELYDPKATNYLNSLGNKIYQKMNNGEIKGTFYVNVIEERTDSTDLVTKIKCYQN